MHAAPAANAEREKVVQRYLTHLDSRLAVKWIDHVVKTWDVNEEEIKHEGRYALIFSLPSNDPMTAYARQIGREHPYDVLGWFCEDMTSADSRPVPCDEMEPVVREFLGRIDGTRNRVTDRLKEISENNKKVSERAMADYADSASMEMLDHRRSVYNIPQVSVPIQLN